MFLSHRQKGSAFNAAYKRIKPDWYFHNPTRANVGSIGRVPETEANALTSPEYQVWRIKDGSLLPAYVEILVKTAFFNSMVQVHRVGAVKQRLFVRNLKAIPIPVVTLESQAAIVARWRELQDRAAEQDRRAQALEAEAQTEFLEALGLVAPKAAQRRNAFALRWESIERWGFEFCTQAVAAKTTPRFECKCVAALARIGSGGTPSRKGRAYFADGTIPWVKTTEVRNSVITETEELITPEAVGNSSAKLYPAGSLIIAMYGQGATRGRTAKLGVAAATNQACCVIFDIAKEIETDFLWFYLQSQYQNLRMLASGNNQPNLNAEMIASFPVPVPPAILQTQLVLALATARHQADAARAEAARLRALATTEAESAILGRPDSTAPAP